MSDKLTFLLHLLKVLLEGLLIALELGTSNHVPVYSLTAVTVVYKLLFGRVEVLLLILIIVVHVCIRWIFEL